MGRAKGKETKALNFRIDIDLADRFKELCHFEELGNSAFLELLILRWDEGINPETKLNTLLNERREIGNQLGGVERKIKEVSEQITFNSDLKRQKIRRKPEALEIIKRHLINQNFRQAEKISKFWQKQTGVSSIELLMEASDQIKEDQEKIKSNVVN